MLSDELKQIQKQTRQVLFELLILFALIILTVWSFIDVWPYRNMLSFFNKALFSLTFLALGFSIFLVSEAAVTTQTRINQKILETQLVEWTEYYG